MVQKFFQLLYFRILGWQISGVVPQIDKYVFTGIPHTSNWDFFYGWIASKALDLNVTIFIKDAVFIWPLQPILRLLGGMPVNRQEHTNFVDSVVARYAENDKLAVAIAPEGTRRYQAELKSGYYHIARLADVPIVLVVPDYRTKSFTIFSPRVPLDTFEEDAAAIIRICRTFTARNPQQTFR